RKGKCLSVEPLAETRLRGAGKICRDAGSVWPLTCAKAVRIRRHADRQRIAGLKGCDSIDSPTRRQFSGDASQIASHGLALAEGQVKNVADHCAVRRVVQRERAFRANVVVILSAGRPAAWLQPAGQCISVADQLAPRIRSKDGTAAVEAFLQLQLPRM